MAKEKKVQKPKKERPKKYESSNLAVKGTLEDLIMASVKPTVKK